MWRPGWIIVETLREVGITQRGHGPSRLLGGLFCAIVGGHEGHAVAQLDRTAVILHHATPPRRSYPGEILADGANHSVIRGQRRQNPVATALRLTNAYLRRFKWEMVI